MFYHDGKLQYKVEVTTPNPVFAKLLQQAIAVSKARCAWRYSICFSLGTRVGQKSTVICS